jgi:hypothetical protein
MQWQCTKCDWIHETKEKQCEQCGATEMTKILDDEDDDEDEDIDTNLLVDDDDILDDDDLVVDDPIEDDDLLENPFDHDSLPTEDEE